MEIHYSQNYESRYSKLIKKNPRLKHKLDNKLRQLLEKQNHPSLRLHKLSGPNEAWSISIDMNIRILFTYHKIGIVLLDIGTHDEVY